MKLFHELTRQCFSIITDEKNSGVSELDDGQLRALLDEAINYKRPKDREGKSNLFRELLEEVEAESDGGEETNPPPFGIVGQCRSGKRHRRDAAVSERQTRGGSLQNIVLAYSDSESAYSGSRGKKSFGGGGGRRKDLGHYGPTGGGGGGRGSSGGGGGGSSGGSSVSARQREGGSLPCNVNAGSGGSSSGGGGGGGSGSCSLHNNPDCPFEAVVRRRRSEQRVVPWDNNEDVMPAQMDRGGVGGPVAAPPPVDSATVGRSEAGVDRVIDGGVQPKGSPDCAEVTAHVAVPDGGGVVANGLLSEGGLVPQQQGVVVVGSGNCRDVGNDAPCVELRAQRCVSLLSVSVEDRTSDGVELQLIPENRSGRGKFKDELCRADPCSDSNPCVPEVLDFVSEQPPISLPASVTSASPAVGSLKTLREMVRGDSVDTVVPFPLHVEEKKPPLVSASPSSMILDLSKGLVNGTDTKPLQLLSSYASVNSVVNPTSQVSSISEPLASASVSSSHSGCAGNQTVQSGVLEERSVLSVATKDASARKQGSESGPKAMIPIHQGTYPLSTHSLGHGYPPTYWRISGNSDAVSRLNFPCGKDLSDIKSKSLDENGNAVTVPQGLNRDAHEKGKGKPRRPKFQDEGYMSESVEGYCGDQDLDRVLKFIGMDEDKKSKNSYSGPVERVRRNNIRRESDRSVASDFTRVKTPRDRNYMEEDISASSADKQTSASKVGPRSAGSSRHNQMQRGSMMKKSNSLEEISRTKSEDLTITASYSMPSKEVKVQKCAMGDDGKEVSSEISAKNEDLCNHNEKVQDDDNGNVETCTNRTVHVAPQKVPMVATSFKEDFYAVTDASPQVLEETEFHVVTKKQRRKKRRGGTGDGGCGVMEGRGGTQVTQGSYSCGGSGSGNGDRADEFSRGYDRTEEDEEGAVMWGSGGTGSDGRFCSYRRHHRRHRGQRSGDCLKSTSSVPPSEHSGESSDDSDSVHSLPVSSSVPRPPADPCSTSSGSTPQASYADIARMPFSTMPVIGGNPGNPPSGNPTPPAPALSQKAKTPVAVPPSGQACNFPPMTTSNPLSTPPVPHFASAKIGTPPVSGYKSVPVVSPPASSVDTPPTVSSSSTNPKPVPVASPSEEHESMPEGEVSIQNSAPALVVTEPQKKDAMTCTALDGKTVSSSLPAPTVCSSQPKVEISETAAHSVNTNTPNILEDYYPSLQESIHEKTERRNGKAGQQPAAVGKVNPTEEKRSSKPAPVPPPVPSNCESKVVEAEIPSASVGPVSEKAAAVLPVTEKPPPIPVAMRTKENAISVTRIKGSGRKPGFRSLPPVVIMDHHYRQDGPSKEGSAAGASSDVGSSSGRNCTSSDIGGFTFGFEVNEELLALSNVDSTVSCNPPPASRPEGGDKEPNGSPSLPSEEESKSLPARPVISPVAPCAPSGKELMPVFRSPGDVDTKKFNYEKIVSFIGSSWEDVLKEMTVPAVKPSGSNRVQYYDGAQ
ncbi:uncharacterized protein LOC124156575 isoform X2 [Ischnura elegans]|uniref:uncharacterized protein LOC124156575 isoform X2 n=1 Tax=Ischnura elegans TaxID=197161 RepID=UPI001ED874A0|nr:uncharacterized protein LOC124156575 isoform X2 [Ischnura elegans]